MMYKITIERDDGKAIRLGDLSLIAAKYANKSVKSSKLIFNVSFKEVKI